MAGNENKILVALDGSDRSFKTVEYLCDFKGFMKNEIVLFNIFSAVPDSYWDMGHEPFSRSVMSEAMGWQHQRKMDMEEFMARSRGKLIASGYDPEQISIRIQNRTKGVARDIIAEASKGYFALLSRRRGAGALFHLVMGSTTTKLIQNLSSIPVLLAGIEKVNNSIFLTIDGSEGSKRAVDFTARVVDGSECRIVLCSVLRNYGIEKEQKSSELPEEFLENFSDTMESAITDAVEKLQSVGIPGNKIERKLILDAQSRAGAIAQAAEEALCDTIVLGRRGKSNVADFNIGRVPWKVIHVARKMTVWIIS